MEEKLLYTSNENLDIIQVEGILNENKIPYIKKEPGIGQYMNITMGTSSQTQNIYVSKENYDEATKLIQNFLNINKSEEDADFKDDLKKARLLRNILIYGFVIAPILIALFAVVLTSLGVI